MKRFLVVAFLALAAIAVSSPQASAGNPGAYGYLPFGFYQPFGAQYGTSIRTPPYFATNPPVYYGARHARPYGISPFASPPMAEAGPGYRSRLSSDFVNPPARPAPPLCNPCVSHSKTFKKKSPNQTSADQASADQVTADQQSAEKEFVIGPIRENPFVDSDDRLAQK